MVENNSISHSDQCYIPDKPTEPHCGAHRWILLYTLFHPPVWRGFDTGWIWPHRPHSLMFDTIMTVPSLSSQSKFRTLFILPLRKLHHKIQTALLKALLTAFSHVVLTLAYVTSTHSPPWGWETSPLTPGCAFCTHSANAALTRGYSHLLGAAHPDLPALH